MCGRFTNQATWAEYHAALRGFLDDQHQGWKTAEEQPKPRYNLAPTRDTDRYRRVVAVCSEGGVDLNEWMVSQGQAIAYRQYSPAYVPAEEKAKAARLGVWAGEFQNPADFRHAGHPGFSGRKSFFIRTTRHIQPHIGSRHTGHCLRPDDLDAAGHSRGARSAASRAGRT